MKDFRSIILETQSKQFSPERALETIKKAEIEIEERIKKSPFDRSWRYSYSRSNTSESELRHEYKELLKHAHTTQLEIHFEAEYDGPGPNYSPSKICFELNRAKCLSSGERV